jgi:CCR4-NOT transcription complex subunit 9
MTGRGKPFEYLRLTSLGVIGALVKVDDPEVVGFLLQTEIIPMCLRIMETGTELSRTVATFILQKILLDDGGLAYICQTADRFFAVSSVLTHMVNSMVDNPVPRLLKHIIRCYLRLTENPKAKEALRQVLPASLQDNTFVDTLRPDRTASQWLPMMLSKVFEDRSYA